MLARSAASHLHVPQPPLTRENIVPYLARRGVLPMDGRAHAETAGRRLLVTVPGGRDLLVRQAEDERGLRTLLQEADVLRALDLPGVVPAVLDEDRDRGVLVIELVRPAEALGNGRLPDLRAAHDAGRLLRRVHEAGERAWRRGLALPDAPPPGWALVEESALLGPLPDAYEACAAQAAAGWRANAGFLHGDVRWENLLLADGSLRLVGWESAGLGNPAWDVACYLAEHVRAWLSDAAPRDACATPARAFLDAHGGGSDVERSAAKLLPLRVTMIAHELARDGRADAARAALALAFDPSVKDALGLA